MLVFIFSLQAFESFIYDSKAGDMKAEIPSPKRINYVKRILV